MPIVKERKVRKPTLKDTVMKKGKLSYEDKCDKVSMGEQYFNGQDYDTPVDPYVPIKSLVDTLPRENTYFHIGQQHEKRPAQVLFCRKCNSDRFYVGVDNHWTGLKCVNCGWEASIHES